MSEQIKRCTKCYGDLEFIESDKVYKCRFCGTIFNDPEKVLKHDLFQKAESLKQTAFCASFSARILQTGKHFSNVSCALQGCPDWKPCPRPPGFFL